MHEIPNYQLSLDSIYIPNNYPNDRIYGFGEILNRKGDEYAYYYSRLYISETPDVSKEHYLHYLYGYINSEKNNGNNCEIWIKDLQDNGYFSPFDYDTLYVRLYAYASTARFVPLREEALGEPSEVFKWVVGE